jgi:hypothetical protein
MCTVIPGQYGGISKGAKVATTVDMPSPEIPFRAMGGEFHTCS